MGTVRTCRLPAQSLSGDVDCAPAPGVSGASPELSVLVAALLGPAQDHFTAAPGTGDAVLFFPDRCLHMPGMLIVSLERRMVNLMQLLHSMLEVDLSTIRWRYILSHRLNRQIESGNCQLFFILNDDPGI